MSRLILRLSWRDDLVEQIRRIKKVELNYMWRFKGKERGFVDISCDGVKIRVNSGVFYNPNDAYDFLVERAKEIELFLNEDIEFNAYYFGRRYKEFSLQ
jgi:hypothetical protein